MHLLPGEGGVKMTKELIDQILKDIGLESIDPEADDHDKSAAPGV